MRNRFSLGIISATVLAASVVAVSLPVSAQEELRPGAGQTVKEGEGQPERGLQALRESAIAYSEDHHVSIEEATRRLRLQGDLEDALEELENALPESFAGAWIEHEPQFRGVVRLTGRGIDPSGAARAIVERKGLPIEFRTGADATVSQLVEQLGSAVPRLQSRNKAVVGAEVDVRTGEIVIFVERDVYAEATVWQEAKELFRAPVRIEAVDAPVGDGHTRGGADLSTCTSGFVVRHPSTGTHGFITAGHCGNDQTFFEFGGASYSTVFIDEIRDADQDVQWHTTSHLELPEFYASSTSVYRPLEAQKNRSSQAVGGYVCHRGKTTGYSCGDIASKTFQPTYSNACPGVTCASVWIRVEGPSLKCFPGDSGGPWFIAYTAYGLYKGQSSSGTSSGDCKWAFYSAANYFGISLLFD